MLTIMSDITAADCLPLVDYFYRRLLADARISYIFTDVAHLDFDKHIPHIATFWEALLFGTGGYVGNAMRPHLELHHKTPLSPDIFAVWLGHWRDSVDALFQGPKAEEAKQKADNIAQLMQHKIALLARP